jgi:hypothetical protein
MDAAGNVVDPGKFARWLLKLEGYSPTRDWQGNQYAPGQFLSSDAYANKVVGAYGPPGPRVVSAPVALMSNERPILPGEPGYQAPQTLPDVLRGNVKPIYPIPGTPPGPAAPPTLPDVLRGNVNSVYPIPGTGQPAAPQTLLDVFPMDSFPPGNILQPPPGLLEAYKADAAMRGMLSIAPPSYGDVTSFNAGPQRPFINQSPWALGVYGPTSQMPGSLDYGDVVDFNRSAANQNLHRGRTGPKGTKDDPVIVKDPDVGDNTDKTAENTDPSNQPEPAEPMPGTPGGEPVEPGIGTAAGTGLGLTTDEDGNLVDSNGNPVKDAVTGLGDVASKAFSDQFAGTPFSDPTQWPATQSVGALLKFFGGLLTGSAGEGLGAFFPGGGGKKPTDKQTRHFNDALRKKDAAIAKAQKELDDINAKPFMYSDEEIQAAKDKVDELKSDRETLIADAEDAGINTSGGPAEPPQPFGPFNIGSPPPAPGGPEGGGAVQPGGGWFGGNLPTGLIPSPGDVIPEPAVAGAPGGGGPNVNINNNINTYDETAARDAQARADNTTINSPLLNLPPAPGG